MWVTRRASPTPPNTGSIAHSERIAALSPHGFPPRVVLVPGDPGCRLVQEVHPEIRLLRQVPEAGEDQRRGLAVAQERQRRRRGGIEVGEGILEQFAEGRRRGDREPREAVEDRQPKTGL